MNVAQPISLWTPGSLILTGTAASIAYPFAAKAYQSIKFRISVATGALSSLVLTGLTAGTYGDNTVYGTPASTAGSAEDVTIGAGINNNWILYGNRLNGEIDLPAAPEQKTFWSYNNSAGAARRTLIGASTDVVNDPTALVFAFSGSVAYTLRLWFPS